MSEMIDRVARDVKTALLAKTGGTLPDELFNVIARAAITAMREPTKEMEAAGEDLDDWGVPSDPGSGNASALSHWVAMIDAALKDD